MAEPEIDHWDLLPIYLRQLREQGEEEMADHMVERLLRVIAEEKDEE